MILRVLNVLGNITPQRRKVHVLKYMYIHLRVASKLFSGIAVSRLILRLKVAGPNWPTTRRSRMEGSRSDLVG
jgi:hypothetical protein